VSGAISPAARAEGARLFQAFQSWGAQPVEVAVLQPAGTLLDVYGEDIRARAYVTQDPARGEMMLRPDFTVPVVQAHMAGGADPARYAYLGEVFRKQEGPATPGRSPEFLQVGYEVFDRENPLRADAEVFALFARLLAGRGLRAAVGDIGLLRAAVQGLPLSDRRRAALMRHLWRPRRFRALLDRFAAPGSVRAPVVTDAPLLGLRTAEEVAERLTWLAEDAAQPPLDARLVTALDRLLSVSDTAPAALAALRGLIPELPWIGQAVDRFETRLALLGAHGTDPDTLAFEGSYGRTTLEYYDGFVFGLYAAGRPDLPPVASGGRYDALTAVLGQGRSIPAVGGVIRPGVLAGLGGAA
jgi:ATP phosphoribosyltransferase regulatory subunit